MRPISLYNSEASGLAVRTSLCGRLLPKHFVEEVCCFAFWSGKPPPSGQSWSGHAQAGPQSLGHPSLDTFMLLVQYKTFWDFHLACQL